MSQENVEIVREVYDDWMQGDFSGGEAFHPEVEFVMTDWPEGPPHAAVRRWRGPGRRP